MLVSLLSEVDRYSKREGGDEGVMEKQITIPTVGMVVKLRKGMLTLSARQVQHIKDVKKLRVNDRLRMSQEEIDGEGGYWIKTDYTKGEWWAWILFRVA